MRRRKKLGHGESSERWLVSYADFITLLFAFFTILFATSQQDTEKSKEFESSVKKYLMKFGAFGDSGEKVNQGVRQTEVLESPIKKHNRNQKSDETLYKIETILESNMTEEEISRTINEMTDDVAGVRISLDAQEIFLDNSDRMRAESIKSLDKIARSLKQTKYKIYIEGHTSDSPIKNAQIPTHWDLSSRRATIMLRYLVKIHNFDPQRLVAISFGKEKPVVENNSPANRRRNNRIDFLIVTESLPL